MKTCRLVRALLALLVLTSAPFAVADGTAVVLDLDGAIAVDEAELLQKLNGRELKLNNQSVTLDTEALLVEKIEPSWRIKFLSTIANPEILLILIMIGVYGLWFEGSSPGAVLPGVAGLLLMWMISYLVKLRRRGAVTGKESILAGTAVAMESFAGTGRVWLEGAPWAAVSKVPIEKDQRVAVTAIDGLTLEAEPASDSGAAETEHKT